MNSRTIILNFSPGSNFWELNPIAIVIFKDFYDRDKSKNKDNSSRIMWAISLYLDMNEANMYRNLDSDIRRVSIASNYLGDRNFVWEDYIIEMDLYKELVMSPLEKEIYLLREAIEDRRNFLSSQRFSTKNIGVLDVAYKQTPIYQQSLLNLEKMLVEGTKNSVNKGNNKDSLLDKLL
ncbi:MAG: hypothetical protein BWX61_00020 [Bacteroidetes bacterium ADurb.Bin035]|jgi:hypothetical protein|nr:MAG: hypothetical protein BWX61_00020 [Bacteroidetes bacterium ADurb.Bin035]TXG84248.1 MAG: hypothetical protein E6R13_03255 [Spirochaetota bacterium]